MSCWGDRNVLKLDGGTDWPVSGTYPVFLWCFFYAMCIFTHRFEEGPRIAFGCQAFG